MCNLGRYLLFCRLHLVGLSLLAHTQYHYWLQIAGKGSLGYPRNFDRLISNNAQLLPVPLLLSRLHHYAQTLQELDSGKFMDAREGNDYASKVSILGLGEEASLADRNLGKSRLG